MNQEEKAVNFAFSSLVVVLHGDFDHEVAEGLVTHGIPVVSLDRKLCFPDHLTNETQEYNNGAIYLDSHRPFIFLK